MEKKQAIDMLPSEMTDSEAEASSYDLADKAKEDFNNGKFREAREIAQRLLSLAEQTDDKDDGEYGIAIHDGNMVLGRLALHDHKLEDAKKYLLAAGKTVGAPTLDSFGPNMSLAKDLLEVGERDTVIQYFHECQKFWDCDFGSLHDWESQVKNGKIPDFGANLVY